MLNSFRLAFIVLNASGGILWHKNEVMELPFQPHLINEELRVAVEAILLQGAKAGNPQVAQVKLVTFEPA